jgi:hypothetical protein
MSDGFLTRWTRRKRAVRAAEAAERVDTDDVVEREAVDAAPRADVAEGDAAADGGTASATARVSADPDASGTAEAADPLPELPDLDALTRESDLAPFLRAGVPAALRNAALRRMWSLDPAIRDFVSEAREYAYDWNTPGGVPGLGPLLPSDDVQAMLRRIMGGLPGDRTAPADTAPATDPEATLDAGAPADGAPEAPDSAMASTAAPEEPEPTLPPPDQGLAGAVSLPSSRDRSEPISGRPELASGPSEAARPRLRRHGGAIPV